MENIFSDILDKAREKLASLLEGSTATEKSAGISDFIQKYKWPIAGAGALGLGAAGLYAINKSVENLPAKHDVGYDIMFFDDPTFPTAWKHKVTFNPDGSVRSDELIPKQASLLEGSTATEKLAGDTSMPTNFSQSEMSTNAEKTADFSLSRLGNGLKEFVNDYKWPLVGIGAAGLGLAGLNYSLNKDLEAYENAPKYADPRYMNEDGSLLPSFTTIRPLQNENIEHLEELIDEKALNKFFANNFNRFNYVKNQDDTYSHVGNTPEWEDAADIYDAYEKEIFGKGGPGHWGYLNDDELPSIEDAKALGFLDHLISTKPYYEGQKSISKTASLKTMHKFADDRFSKAIEQIAKNSVNNAIKNDTIAKAKSFGVAGLGLGALSGLGYTYFNSDEDNPSSVSDYIKNGLIGSGIGGVSGAGIGALNGLIPGYRSRTERINNIIQAAKDNGKAWAYEMEGENGRINFSSKDKNWDMKMLNKMDDLVSDHNKKIRDKYQPLQRQYQNKSWAEFDKVRSDLSDYVPGTGKGEDSGIFSGSTLHDYLSRIDAYINSGILNKHEADIVRNYVKDIDPFDFTHDDLVNITRAIESAQKARREKVVNRLYNYLSTQKTAGLKTADFLTRFGQDLGGAVDYALPAGVVGGLLGLAYNDLAGGNPDDASKSYFKGHNIGALLGGLYGATSAHLKISDKIKGFNDLIARRAATISPDPSYALRTDKLKSALDALTKGGFIKGFETFI